MATLIAAGKESGKNPALGVTWVLVAGLFILRVPLLAGIRIFTPSAGWANPVFEIGTYFLGALLIWRERNHLADFHVDRLVLFIFILGKPLELLLVQLQIPFATPSRSAAYMLYLPIALGLGIAMLAARPNLPAMNIRLAGWLLVGILAGLVLGVYSGNLIKANLGPGSSGSVNFRLVLLLPLQQLLSAGINEEPFFRGFLWGILRKSGLKDVWVWLIQAGVFWLAHAYYLFHGVTFSFLFIVPVGGLVMGWLAWRSRSIAVSMLAHGISNGIGQIVGYFA
jgi:membrane protease YdiL (CAAX protease family)